jgi:hypothetical protein
MAFTAIQVTGTYQSESGAPASGTLTFQLTQAMENTNVVITPSPIVVTLDSSGHFTQTLLANDDAGTVPPGVMYGVTEQVTSAEPRDYFITIPSGLGGTVDISTLMPGAPGWS